MPRPRQGLAFDTNLLSRPLTRRLLALWMETAGATVVVLPTVKSELLAGTGGPDDAMYEQSWQMLWEGGNDVYEVVELNDQEREDVERALLDGFTLRCFPKLDTADEIPRCADARIISEAVAANIDMVVTNNMSSVDHREVNSCLRGVLGFNRDLVQNADDALLSAHQGGESSRELLAMYLASTWPDGGEAPMSIEDCHRTLERHHDSMAVGARMPNVAERLKNAFAVDTELEALIESARAIALSSPALRVDNERRTFLRQHARRSGIPISRSEPDA